MNPAWLDWMKRLRWFLDNNYQASAPVVLCGDFNVAPEDRDVHNPRLWQERIMCSQAERAALDEIKRWGFTDSFRLHHEEGGQFSWWDYRAGAFRRNMGLRIDHALAHLLQRRQSAVERSLTRAKAHADDVGKIVVHDVLQCVHHRRKALNAECFRGRGGDQENVCLRRRGMRPLDIERDFESPGGFVFQPGAIIGRWCLGRRRALQAQDIECRHAWCAGHAFFAAHRLQTERLLPARHGRAHRIPGRAP